MQSNSIWRPVLIFVIVVELGLATGYSQTKPATNNDSITIFKLAATVVSLEKKIKLLELLREADVERINSLEELEPKTTILLNVGQHGYQVIGTKYTIFFVALDNCEKYLNGYKIHLRIGNIASFDFSGFKVTFKWGKKYSEKVGFNNWEKGMREQEFNSVKVLKSGLMNPVDFELLPAADDELGFLSMQLDVSQIRAPSPNE